MDDGDPSTFWKSNPYLDEHFTGEPNWRYPQWVVIDLGKSVAVDTLRIAWGEPRATKLRLEAWTGDDPLYNPGEGKWRPLTAVLARPSLAERGKRSEGTCLTVAMGLEKVRFQRYRCRYFRLELLASVYDGTVTADVRDRVGFAIRELALGRTEGIRFTNAMRYGKNKDSQTALYASSTDPWHRASDLDDKVEQPGFDAVIRSGLASGLPMLMATSALYDTPETVEAQAQWLRARGVALRGFEVGEEPDGQYATPEHYAQLYRQMVLRLRDVLPQVPVGGPGYQTAIPDVLAWPDQAGKTSWTARLIFKLRALRERLDFFSFEWYPWDDTLADPHPQLAAGSKLLADWLALQRSHGVPKSLPVYATEFGYSAFSARAEVDLPGGILNADIVGTFLSHGGTTAYLYGYEPNELIAEEPNAWGNLMMLQVGEDGNVKWKLPTYWTSWLLTHVWTLPGHETHRIVASRLKSGGPDLGVYAVLRPDGRVAVLLVNRNPRWVERVLLPRGGEVWSYGPRQFVWKAAGEAGAPSRSLPPEHGGCGREVVLQPYSVNVVVLR